MPSRETRKIMKHGQSSGVVAIPKPYRDYHGLNPGATVTILYDTLLLIVPKGKENLLVEKAQLIDQLLGQTKPEASR